MPDVPMLSLIADFACGRRCTVEFDVTDVQVRYTRGHMERHVTAAHDAAHRQEPPQRAYRYDAEVVVKAGAL